MAARERYATILSYTGLVLLPVALIMLLTAAAVIFWPQERPYAFGFLIPGGILAAAGGILWKSGPRVSSPLSLQEGGIIVVVSWLLICFASTVPFIYCLGFSFTPAFFEAVSGWTTTGLSVVDVTKSPRIILLWRSIMQLGGGAGFAIIVLAAIAGPAGTSLSRAEGRGDQLLPHVRNSAKLVLAIYSAYALLGTVAYWLAGMGWFDAVNHSFAAVSTGGFSTRAESIGYFDNPSIEFVSYPLMLLGNLNFITAHLIFTGKFRAALRSGELRLSFVLFLTGVAILFFLVCQKLYTGLDKQVRVAVFETITALTTTGFSTTTYDKWNSIGIFLIIVLMLIGGGTGSTAGGLKQYRIYLLWKSFIWEIRRALLPHSAVVENWVWCGQRKEYVRDANIRRIALFFYIYLIAFFLGSGIIAAHGYGLQESLFEFASSLGTVGLSVGLTSIDAPVLVLYTQIFGMLLGRLEFFVVVISIVKIFSDLRNSLL
jgi:trk system potassium uptake protein TrkH